MILVLILLLLAFAAVLGVVFAVERAVIRYHDAEEGAVVGDRFANTVPTWASSTISAFPSKLLDLFGERGGTRTLDPMIKSHVLYRLSYALTCPFIGSLNQMMLAPGRINGDGRGTT